MKFGQSTAEHEAAVASSGGEGGDYIRYMRKGDNIIQIVDEYPQWIWYWEHYNPGGYPFPCTGERDTCPGCTSNIEKMKKANKRACFNAVHTYEGQSYVNVWKVPKTVAEKLKNRYDRNGTIVDRPYMITQIRNEGGTEYDIEGEMPVALDWEAIKAKRKDPEALLAAAYEDAWGDPSKAAETSAKAAAAAREDDLQTKVSDARSRLAVKRDVPAEPEPTYSESDLRKMDPFNLLDLCVKEGLGDPPAEAKTADQIVDWMLTQAQVD